jgi:hypothetical protein
MAICYALTTGEDSDYRILAIFSTRELAEQQRPLWPDEWNDGIEIEEFPFDHMATELHEGMRYYTVRRDAIDGPLQVNAMGQVHGMRNSAYGNSVVKDEDHPSILYTHMAARDAAHAIKIASERFARFDAEAAGAC